MADIIKAWCVQNNVSVSLDYLRKVSWSGATDTVSFNNLYPDGTMERQEIMNAIQSEIFPNDPTESPIGTLPCN